MPFFKILNEKERHNRMHYKTGLNVDVLPFNPQGTCTSGGIYFSDEKHICEFLNYGPWIREVTFPNDEDLQIYKDPGGSKWKANKILLGPRMSLKKASTWRTLLDCGVDLTADDNAAIQDASSCGHVEVVKILLSDKRVDPTADDNHAIRWASAKGHVEVVKILLSDKRVDPTADNNYAILWASERGHVEVVKILLSDKRVDPTADDNHAIRWASAKGHVEVVKILYQHDPDHYNKEMPEVVKKWNLDKKG